MGLFYWHAASFPGSQATESGIIFFMPAPNPVRDDCKNVFSTMNQEAVELYQSAALSTAPASSL